MLDVVGFSFDEFRIDLLGERLFRGPAVIPLMPKAFALLTHLAANAGRLLRTEELLAALWPEGRRSAAGLKTCICQLRRALGDSADGSRFIETAHRRGYRFIAQVQRVSAPPPRSPSSLPN